MKNFAKIAMWTAIILHGLAVIVLLVFYPSAIPGILAKIDTRLKSYNKSAKKKIQIAWLNFQIFEARARRRLRRLMLGFLGVLGVTTLILRYQVEHGHMTGASWTLIFLNILPFLLITIAGAIAGKVSKTDKSIIHNIFRPLAVLSFMIAFGGLWYVNFPNHSPSATIIAGFISFFILSTSFSFIIQKSTYFLYYVMMILAVMGALVNVADKSSASVHAFFENIKQSDDTSAAKQEAEKQLKKAEERRTLVDARNIQKLTPFTALCNVPCYDSGVVTDSLVTGERLRMDFTDSTQHPAGIWLFAAYHNEFGLTKAGYIEPNKCIEAGWNNKQNPVSKGRYEYPLMGLNWPSGTIVQILNPNKKSFMVTTSAGEKFHISGEPDRLLELGYAAKNIYIRAEGSTELIWPKVKNKNIEVI